MKTLWQKHMAGIPDIMGDQRRFHYDREKRLQVKTKRARQMVEKYIEYATLRDLADEYGISRERVRQLIKWYMQTYHPNG